MKRLGFLLMIATIGLTSCSYGDRGNANAQIDGLMSPADMSNKEASAKNNEGVDHLVQGHYDVAVTHLNEAIAKKADFAEAHFNLATALDGMGKHPEATEAFKKAKEFGGTNPKITDNASLKKHLGT
jgi:Flp pilus assembly protein TadD